MTLSIASSRSAIRNYSKLIGSIARQFPMRNSRAIQMHGWLVPLKFVTREQQARRGLQANIAPLQVERDATAMQAQQLLMNANQLMASLPPPSRSNPCRTDRFLKRRQYDAGDIRPRPISP